MPVVHKKDKRSGHFSPLLISILLTIILFIVFITFYLKNIFFDNSINQFFSGYSNPGLTRVMLAITFLGKHSFLIPANLILIILFLIRKKYKTSLIIAFVSLSSLGLMTLLKNLFHRLRPGNPLITQGVSGYSFPSGHALMSVVFYGLLIWWIVKYRPHNFWWKLIIIFLVFLMFLIGFSRIYLRVHYTTDVLAGFCIGTCWLLVSVTLINHFMDRYENKNTGNHPI